KSLIDLPLVDRAVAHIAERDGIAALIFLAEGKAGAKRDAGADNAMPAEEVGLAREHMHGAALALGIATLAARKFGHHAFRIHAADEHMTVVAVRGDLGILIGDRGIHADNDGLLPDIEMAEAADHPHPVDQPGLLL